MPGRKVPEAERRRQLLQAAYRIAACDGLDQITARRVADEAGASPGLVFFHFGSKDGLLLALLDDLLEGALDAEITPEVAALPSARSRLLRLLAIEVEGMPEQREAIELFFAYWVSLGRQERHRRRIDAALERYRAVFAEVCRDLVDEETLTVDPELLTTLVLAQVQGLAVQVVRQPDRFDVEALTASLQSALALPTG